MRVFINELSFYRTSKDDSRGVNFNANDNGCD